MPGGARRVPVVALTAALGIVASLSVLGLAGAVAGNLDDAFITLVYARHLAAHGGLFWNATDGAVEGFTSLLDVLLKAALLSVSDDGLQLAWWMAVSAHVVVSFTVFGAVFLLAKEQTRRRRLLLATAAGVVAGANDAVTYGTTFLLETPLFIALALWSLLPPMSTGLSRLGPRLVWTGALLATVLARPEALVLVVFVVAMGQLRRGRPATTRDWAIPMGLVALTICALCAWRFTVFGTWAPNTYYAKTSASRLNEVLDGLSYVGRYTVSSLQGLLAVAVPLLLPIAMLKGPWSRNDRISFALVAGSALGMLVLVVLTGGDCYAGGRFLALPAVLAIVGLGFLATRDTAALARPATALLGAWAALVGVSAVVQLQARIDTVRLRWPRSDDQYACEARVARRLATLVGENGTVAQSDFQRLKYLADDLRVVDLHGLSDHDIAHSAVAEPVTYGKFTHAHALEIDAEVWVYGWKQGSRDIPMAAAAMDDLLATPAVYERFVGYPAPEPVRAQMKLRYLPASIPECNAFFNVLVRRDVAPRFADAGILVGDGEGRPLGPTTTASSP